MAEKSAKAFIIDTNDIDTPIAKKASRSAPTYSFEVLMQNEIDFVVKRTTKSSSIILAVLPSQELFYTKNEKNGEILSLDIPRYSRFFNGHLDDVKAKLTDIKWDALERYAYSQEWKIKALIEAYKPDMQAMCTMLKRGMYDSYRDSNISKKVAQNYKLYMYMTQPGINDTLQNSKFNNIFDDAHKVFEAYGLDRARSYVDAVIAGPVQYNFYNTTFITLYEAIKLYKLDFNRVLKYIFVDLYAQGMTQASSNTINDYVDFLRMQHAVFGKVKVKYPKALKTEHDIISMKHRLIVKYDTDDFKFEYPPAIKDLTHVGRALAIFPAKTAKDVVDEGVNQSHCVASYVSRIKEGKTFILFLRNKKEPETSQITVEVKMVEGEMKCTQAAGFGMRRLDAHESYFLRRWAKNKKVEISTSYVMEENTARRDIEAQKVSMMAELELEGPDE